MTGIKIAILLLCVRYSDLAEILRQNILKFLAIFWLLYVLGCHKRVFHTSYSTLQDSPALYHIVNMGKDGGDNIPRRFSIILQSLVYLCDRDRIMAHAPSIIVSGCRNQSIADTETLNVVKETTDTRGCSP